MERSGRARSSLFRPAVPPRAGARFSAARRCRPPFLFLPARAPRPRAITGERGPGEARKFSGLAFSLEPNDTRIHVSALPIVRITLLHLRVCSKHSCNKELLFNHELALRYESTQTPRAYQGIGVKIKADKKKT